MKFKSGEEMLEALNHCDLYCLDLQLYLFLYNEDGAICEYRLPYAKALEIQEQAKIDHEYWGAYLGIGGSIYDPPSNIEYCNDMFKYNWIDTDEVANGSDGITDYEFAVIIKLARRTGCDTWLSLKVADSGNLLLYDRENEEFLLAKYAIADLKDAVDSYDISHYNLTKFEEQVWKGLCERFTK